MSPVRLGPEMNTTFVAVAIDLDASAAQWASSPDFGDVGVGACGDMGVPQIRVQRGLVSSAFGADTPLCHV